MIQQMTKMMVMLVLAIGLTAGAATAQIKGGGSVAPVGIYTGTETAEGTFDQLSQIHYGDTFVMNSFGEWESYHLTVSLNYSTNQFFPTTSIVTGGTWSLVVVRDNQYAGTLYGEVQTGSLSFTGSGENISKNVQVNLRSTGGSGLFPRKDNETVSGVYSATTVLRTKETTGNASFNF
jgi:hypothetical protein